MVAIVFGEVDHAVRQLPAAPDEHDGIGVTFVGGLLKVPVAMNCTRPFGKSCASALAGVAMTDTSIRGLLLPHPTQSAAKLIIRIRGVDFIESSHTIRGHVKSVVSAICHQNVISQPKIVLGELGLHFLPSAAVFAVHRRFHDYARSCFVCYL